MREPVTTGIRIIVTLDPADEQGMDSEALWAERVSADTFRIRNSPFFAFDLSLDDVIRAEKVDGDWHFREVVNRSGHSTYRAYLLEDRNIGDDDVQQAIEPITTLGAEVENANDRFFAIDIPPGKPIAAIYDLLEQTEATGLWEFEEAHYEPNA